MAGIAQRIETFLGEFRIVVPALGALLGFQLMAAFQASFGELPEPTRLANYFGVLCTALALILLLAPGAYHRRVHHLDESADFLRFAQRIIGAAYAFLVAGLTLSLYVQGVQTFRSDALAWGGAAVVAASMAGGWWLLPWLMARRAAGR